MMNSVKNLTAPTLSVLLILSLGCTGKKPEPEGYRVMSYDAATHQWTILRTYGKYLRKRLTVVCSSFQWKNQSGSGPEACHLDVGRMIIPNPRKFLFVFELATETLSIDEGAGDDRVMQQFTILKYEVLPDNE